METLHAEGESPFVVNDEASIAAVMAMSQRNSSEYVNCQVEGCGEAILLTELDDHMEMHGEEGEDDRAESFANSESSSLKRKWDFDTKLPSVLRNFGHHVEESSGSSSSDRQTVAKAAWKGILKMPDQNPKALVATTTSSARRRLGVSIVGSCDVSRVADTLVEIRTRSSRE